ncbi:Ig-like domain-containing protein [Planomonospora algeriensis]
MLKVTYTDTVNPGPTPTATPTPEPDTVPPTILKVEPVDGTEDAPADAQVKVTFSEPVTDARLSLTDIFEETEVPGSTTMDAGNTVLTFTPNQPLDFYYWAEVSGAKDAAGNVMDGSYGWSFSIEQQIPTPTEPSACRTAPAWTSGGSYPVGTQVKHRGHAWESIPLDRFQSRQEPGTGNGWGWRDLGACTSGFSSSTSEKQAGPESPLAEARSAKPSVDKVWTRSLEAKDGAALVPTTTPELLVKVSDPLKRHSAVEVEIEHDPKSPSQGKGLIWSGTTTVPSGSVGSIQVPDRKLANGWKVRWRARATAGAVSSLWSDWKNLSTASSSKRLFSQENATAFSSALAPPPVKNILPMNGDGIPPASYSECRANSETIKKTGYSKNRFSYCVEKKWRATRYSIIGSVAGNVSGRILVRVAPRQDIREFEVSQHVTIDSQSGDMDGVSLEFPIETADMYTPAESPECGRVRQEGTGFRTIGEWKSDNKEWQRVESFQSNRQEPNAKSQAPDKIGQCAIELHLVAKDTRFFVKKRVAVAEDFKVTVRCDTSPGQKYHNGNGGGCVHLNAVPAFSMARSDENNKGVSFPDMYDHIKGALARNSTTAPQPGGRTFPDAVQLKNLPGGSPNDPLTRVMNGKRKAANNGAKDHTCDIEFRERKGWGKEGLACDEFPFAATNEGAAYADPDHFYSVQLVDATQNSQHGTILNAWFLNNRILRGDEFWVKIN